MSSNNHTGPASGKYSSYIIGFLLSVGLTAAAYYITVQEVASRQFLVSALLFLAVVQLFVQLVFFLHLDGESKPRWNLTVLLFAALVATIVVFGSLWIMANLDYQHGGMTPSERDNYIIKDEGIHR